MVALNKGMYPAPVVVGQYDNGQLVRLSFWSQVGKPIDFERAESILTAIGVYGTAQSDLVSWHVISHLGKRVAPVAPLKQRANYKQTLTELLAWLDGDNDNERILDTARALVA